MCALELCLGLERCPPPMEVVMLLTYHIPGLLCCREGLTGVHSPVRVLTVQNHIFYKHLGTSDEMHSFLVANALADKVTS